MVLQRRAKAHRQAVLDCGALLTRTVAYTWHSSLRCAARQGLVSWQNGQTILDALEFHDQTGTHAFRRYGKQCSRGHAARRSSVSQHHFCRVSLLRVLSRHGIIICCRYG